MEKSNYKLFFYLGDKPININLKHVLNQQNTQPNETRSKLFNQDIQKNIYTKAKQNYEFLMKKNKNIFMLNKKGGKFPSKEYLEAIDNFGKKLKKENFSLLAIPPHKKENNKSVEELRRIQRNKVNMRRIEYSMKVKHATNKKRSKYNIKKVITIQKWVRGFLLRNLLSNLSYFEDFTNEFMEHIKKFVFLKHKKLMKDIINYLQYKINRNIDNENKDYKSLKNLINNKKEVNLDIIRDNNNERYIDDDSIMEYNNRYNKNNSNNTNKNAKKINNNILFFSSKDFSDKLNLNQKSNNFNSDTNSNILFNSEGSGGNINNNINNTNLFKLNESSIGNETNKDGIINNNKKKEDTLNSNKEENFKNIKNEEVHDLFGSKYKKDLLMPSPKVINNIIINNVKTETNDEIEFNNINLGNQLFIRRPKLNRKFIEEINNTHASATPTKYYNYLNNDDTDSKNNKDKLVGNNQNQNEKEKDVIQKREKNQNIKNINSTKSNTNQICSISNPTSSTLDSNTLNINRKFILDENININVNNNNKAQLEKEKEVEVRFVKPIILTCHITKIRINKIKIKFEKLSIKYTNSEKKFVPRIFDMNYQYSEENQNLNISKISKNQNEPNHDDTLKNMINMQNDSTNIINYEINKNDSTDININVLKVVNNNIDELNNSIKNIVKEELPSPSPDINQNKQNIFTKSLRELLKLDQQKNNNNNAIINSEEENNSFNNNDIMDNSDNIQNKENDISNNKISIEAIKEVKEEYEEEKENESELTQKKFISNISNNSELLDIDNNKNSNLKCDKNITFSFIQPKKYDKRKIILVYMFEKQIKYNIKPYIFNTLKRFWIDKLKRC